MLRQFEHHVGRLFAVALVTIGAGIALAHHQSAERTADERWVSHTHEVLGEFDAMLSRLDEAELEERQFALTGTDRLLVPFERDGLLVEQQLADVRDLVGDNPGMQRRIDTLMVQTARKMATMRDLIRARREGGLEGAARAAIARADASDIATVRDTVRALQRDEQRLLAMRQASLARSTRLTTWAILGLGVASLLMLTLAFLTAQHARRRQAVAEQSAIQANAELRLHVDELLRHGRESVGLQQLNVALQLCITASEAYAAVERILPALLGASSCGGVLAVLRTPKHADRVATWGDQLGIDRAEKMPVEDCCALRSGRPYSVQSGELGLRCGHTDADSYLCLPLAAHGETLGVLQVMMPSRVDRIPAQSPTPTATGVDGRQPVDLLQRASEQIAITLANLALRERLEHQSVRDALTGTFNRRYFEESLEQALAREQRRPRGLTLVMVDVDHFKAVNDTHGHDAGDDVLRKIAQTLQQSVRASDLVCRFGGEEFAILLLETDAEAARRRTEAIVQACRTSQPMAHGRAIGPVTVSAGLARHHAGESGADLVRRADASLYEAKRQGRDRVVDSSTTADHERQPAHA